MEVDEEEEEKDVDFQEVKHHLDEAKENARQNASRGTAGFDLGDLNSRLTDYKDGRLKDEDDEMNDDEEKSKRVYVRKAGVLREEEASLCWRGGKD